MVKMIGDYVLASAENYDEFWKAVDFPEGAWTQTQIRAVHKGLKSVPEEAISTKRQLAIRDSHWLKWSDGKLHHFQMMLETC